MENLASGQAFLCPSGDNQPQPDLAPVLVLGEKTGQGGREEQGEGLVPVAQAMLAGISRGQCGSREARWMQQGRGAERKEAAAWSLQGLSLRGSWEG